MKHLILTLLVFFACFPCFSQEKFAKVTLKNGTTITGIVVDFNPTSHITLDVAGFETKLDMTDVASVNGIVGCPTSEEKPIIIEDTSRYPEKFDLRIGPYVIGMILVKGGSFSMGYDGRGSMKFNSEPVHTVGLHSFYVNAKPLSNDLVRYIKKGKEKHSEYAEAFTTKSPEDIIWVVDQLNSKTNVKVNLITEAQWEYIATKQQAIFTGFEKNVCLDYYAPYRSSTQIEVDPNGPQKGSLRVIRTFDSEPNLFERLPSSTISQSLVGLSIRLSFPAAQLIENQ